MAAWTIPKLIDALRETGFTVRHDHVGPDESFDKYVCWYSDESGNFFADDTTYVLIPTFNVELIVSGGRVPSAEDVVQNVLKKNGIPWKIRDAGWDKDENCWITIYTFQLIMEDNDDASE